MKRTLIIIVAASLVLAGLMIPVRPVEAQAQQGTQTQQQTEPQKAGPYNARGTTDLDDFEDVTNPALGKPGPLDQVTQSPQQNDRQIVNSSEWVTFGSIDGNRFFTDYINSLLKKQITSDMLYRQDPAHAAQFYEPGGHYLRWQKYSDQDLVNMGLRKIKINRRFAEVLWSKINGVLKFRVVYRDGAEIWASDVKYDQNGQIVSFTPVCDGWCRNPAPWIGWMKQVVRETVTQNQCVVTGWTEDASKRVENADSTYTLTLHSNCGDSLVTIPKIIVKEIICKGGFNLVEYSIFGIGDHPNHGNIAKAKRFKLKEEVDLSAEAIAQQFVKQPDQMDQKFINGRSVPELTAIFLNAIHKAAPETNDPKLKAKVLQIWQNVCQPDRFMVFWYDEKEGWHWKEFLIGVAVGFVGGFLLCHFTEGAFQLMKPVTVVTSPS